MLLDPLSKFNPDGRRSTFRYGPANFLFSDFYNHLAAAAIDDP